MKVTRRGFAQHIILELWDAKNTNSPNTVRKALSDACTSGNLEIDKVFVHQFSPYGVSGVAVIAESHITIHTWPEYSFAAVDIYSCKPDADVQKVARVIRAAFSPCQVNRVDLRRGRKHAPVSLGQ
jgi:S-adenosylmethionine decarboxylase proenzyme